MLDLFKKFKAKRRYRKTLQEVSSPILANIEHISEKEFKEFFRWTVEASERSLRCILFMTPMMDFDRDITKEEIDFWLRRVSLVCMAYSYWCLMLVKQDSLPQNFLMVGVPLLSFWKKISDYYKQVFGEELNQKDIDYYAAGYKEDVKMGYSKTENHKKTSETCRRDSETIGTELFKKIWGEDSTEENYNKRIIIGGRIWQAHAQLVRPCLMKMNTGW